MLEDGHPAGRPPLNRRRHDDDDGVLSEAGAVIGRHGPDGERILGIAEGYGAAGIVVFNKAPADDFMDTLVGEGLVRVARRRPAFGAFYSRFNSALEPLDYGTSDGIIDRRLVDGIIAGHDGGSVYGDWRRAA